MENKVKILWIASSVPYSKSSHAGGKTFTYYFNKFINDGRFEIKLIGFNDGIAKEDIEKELVGIEHKIVYKEGFNLLKIINLESHFNPWHRYAGMISNYYAFKTLKYVKEYNEEGFRPDVIILEWTNIVLLMPKIKKIYPDAKYVASEHDVSFVGAKRRLNFFTGIHKNIWKQKYINLKKREIAILKQCDLVLPHNPENIQLLKTNGCDENKQLWLIPYFHNMVNCERNFIENNILFFGAMGRPENYLSAIWFIDNVMPRISDLDVNFLVLGGNPPKQLRLYENDRIHIKGFVESIVPFFEHSLCMVAPLVLGAGIKVKILEGLSSGIPVLTNKIGIEGIPAVNGHDYFLCEEPAEYEECIRNIYKGNIDTLKIANNAKNFMKSYALEKSVQNYKSRILEMR